MNFDHVSPHREAGDGLSTSFIKAEAVRLGFDACGVARVLKVDDSTREAFNRWIGEGRHAGMDYMTRYSDARYHPDSVLPGCRTIVSLALNYYPAHHLSDDQYQFAYYAYGRDYHDVMKARIRELARAIGLTAEYKESGERPSNSILFRVAVDSAPLLERYWAMQAGIGWIGRNHNLIVPHRGSFIVLGELLLTAEVDSYDQPIPNHCGTCHRCIEACPTCALTDSGVDASRCLSYLTIEHRGPFSAEQAELVRQQPTPYYIYGCDRCQRACPHNQFATPNTTEEFQPSKAFLDMSKDDWRRLTREDYQQLFRGSPVKRAKFEGLVRNIDTLQD